MKGTFLKNFFSLRYRHKQPLTNPHFMWHIILAITLLLLLILGIWSSYIFTSVQREEFLTESVINSKLDIIDQKVLEDIISYYTQKGKKFDEIRDNPARFIDPSI